MFFFLNFAPAFAITCLRSHKTCKKPLTHSSQHSFACGIYSWKKFSSFCILIGHPESEDKYCFAQLSHAAFEGKAMYSNVPHMCHTSFSFRTRSPNQGFGRIDMGPDRKSATFSSEESNSKMCSFSLRLKSLSRNWL